MNLDDAQKRMVAAWIEEGLKLSEIQSRVAAEFGVQLTYMETRFLVDDLKLTPKDQPPPQPVGTITPQVGPKAALPGEDELDEPAAPAGAGGVSVSVDRVARPGAMVSGSVTFSDGKTGAWYLDQTGRLGIVPKEQGYRPAPEDVQVFQAQLQTELAKLGF